MNGRIAVHFPLVRRPRGGADCAIEIQLRGGPDARAALQGLLEAGYPYRSEPSAAALVGLTLLGQEIPVRALALSFAHGGGRLYRIKGLVERAVWMIRRGEWQRLSRAVLRRVPRLIHKVRHAALG